MRSHVRKPYVSSNGIEMAWKALLTFLSETISLGDFRKKISDGGKMPFLGGLRKFLEGLKLTQQSCQNFVFNTKQQQKK